MVAAADCPDSARVNTESLCKGVVGEWRAGYVEATNLGYVFMGKFRSCASAQVLRVRHWFKMIRAQTGRIATEVVKRQSLRNRSVCLFVTEAVREDSSTVPTYPPIPERIFGVLPDPARRYVTAVDHIPQIVAPFHTWRDSTVVAFDEASVLTLHCAISSVVLGDERGRLSTATLAKFFSHVGLLNRLAVGGGGIGRCPHSMRYAG
jgi:hypothetical protein